MDACRRGGADRLLAVAPYFGCARQDRRTRAGRPVGVRVVAEALEVRARTGLVMGAAHRRTGGGVRHTGGGGGPGPIPMRGRSGHDRGRDPWPPDGRRPGPGSDGSRSAACSSRTRSPRGRRRDCRFS
ncbi:ribose-phosphate pyrophosphokinase-like domain-containing protein [Streptomyces sp. NPDC007875]|uniref:ribose-phosphate pyrophosphokinase-like domain-containing protein n=1 Tax=Streptomyces sp. NPDC007875 TaxID=3364783 RepID=UPI00367DE2D6